MDSPASKVDQDRFARQSLAHAAWRGFLDIPNPQGPTGARGTRSTPGTGGHSLQSSSPQLAPESPRKLSSALASLDRMALAHLAGLLSAVKASASCTDVLQVFLAGSGRVAPLLPAELVKHWLSGFVCRIWPEISCHCPVHRPPMPVALGIACSRPPQRHLSSASIDAASQLRRRSRQACSFGQWGTQAASPWGPALLQSPCSQVRATVPRAQSSCSQLALVSLQRCHLRVLAETLHVQA